MMAGAALAFKLRGEARVAVPFFGDGATNTGAFHESMNLAQLWKLPVVFVLENNGWAESTPASQQLPLAVEDMEHRALAYGMQHVEVDGQDVEAVYAATREAREHATQRRGPGVHQRPHVPVHRPLRRRSAGVSRQGQRCARSPRRTIRSSVSGAGSALRGGVRARRRARCRPRSTAVVEFAKSGTDPAPEDALKWVYAEGSMERLMAEMTYREAVRDVLSQLMRGMTASS